jgi:hypothetical protein
MDPNLFHLDWERASEVLATVVIMSFMVERALALIFESKWFIKKFTDTFPKEILAGIVGAAVTIAWKFDAISMIILTDHVTLPGEILTGLVVAGGSKASIKLFHDWLGIRSSAHEIAHPEDPVTKKPQPEFDKAAVAAKL